MSFHWHPLRAQVRIVKYFLLNHSKNCVVDRLIFFIQNLIEKNKEVCKRKAGTDICGFGADEDIYLDSQERDPKLTFKTAHFSASESKSGEVEVHFNVYPSIKDKGGYYKRKIVFKMMKEADRWVVDDIFYGGKSARKQIADEIQHFENISSK